MIFLLQTVSVPCQLFSPKEEGSAQREQREELEEMAIVLWLLCCSKFYKDAMDLLLCREEQCS